MLFLPLMMMNLFPAHRFVKLVLPHLELKPVADVSMVDISITLQIKIV
jgi:hypothetical protein